MKQESRSSTEDGSVAVSEMHSGLHCERLAPTVCGCGAGDRALRTSVGVLLTEQARLAASVMRPLLPLHSSCACLPLHPTCCEVSADSSMGHEGASAYVRP
jgi:hypothetical protein